MRIEMPSFSSMQQAIMKSSSKQRRVTKSLGQWIIFQKFGQKTNLINLCQNGKGTTVANLIHKKKLWIMSSSPSLMCNLGPNLTKRKEKHVVYGFQPIKGIFNHPFSVLPKNLRVQDCESKVFKIVFFMRRKIYQVSLIGTIWKRFLQASIPDHNLKNYERDPTTKK